MGGGPCSLLVGCSAQPSLLSIVGCCHHSWVVWSAIVSVGRVVVGCCGRWWWAIIGVGGGPSLALIGGGGESLPPVMSPGVSASNHRHAIVVSSSPVLAVWLLFPIVIGQLLSFVVIHHCHPSLLCYRWLLSLLRCTVVVVLLRCVIICWWSS